METIAANWITTALVIWTFFIILDIIQENRS